MREPATVRVIEATRAPPTLGTVIVDGYGVAAEGALKDPSLIVMAPVLYARSVPSEMQAPASQ